MSFGTPSLRPVNARLVSALTGLGLALGLVGCAGSQVPFGSGPPVTDALVEAVDVVSDQSVDSSGGQDDPALAAFYEQTIAWADCPTNSAQCGRIEVPMDWSDPTGPRITVAFGVEPASNESQRLGLLLVNPGGPGASGISDLDYLISVLPKTVLEHYDVVGFDPRGVGLSNPVKCLGDDEMDAYIEWLPDPAGTDTIAKAHQVADDFGRACLANTGPALGFVDSLSTARDMDVIRALLGDDKLNFLGFSYGTLLGALYAETFTDRVGRLVLDGAVDPALTAEESSAQQIIGFEQSLRAYLTDCQANSNCPLTGGVDTGAAQLGRFLVDRRTDPLPTKYDRLLTESTALTGVLVAMYSKEAWSTLTLALQQAMEDGDGTTLLTLSDLYYERDSNTGAFQSNMFQAFAAIGCLDQPTDARRSALDQAAAKEAKLAPTFGKYGRYGSISCAEWPYPARLSIGPITANGSPPIVVVGTTGDPATPYANAVAMAKALDSGVLVTYQGEGHTAFGQGVACIDDAIAAYLVEGTVPQDGMTCE